MQSVRYYLAAVYVAVVLVVFAVIVFIEEAWLALDGALTGKRVKNIGKGYTYYWNKGSPKHGKKG